MITRQPFLNKLGLILLFTSSVASAQVGTCPKDFNVVERNPKGSGFTFQSRTLEDLNCDDTFEGKYFKIVHGTNSKPIHFEHVDPELVKKAANVYHHLTIARNHWVNVVDSAYVKSLPQITIRLDIANTFSSVRHFKNAEQEKNFNNAWTIPEGETPKTAQEKLKWGKEIWFSPMKKLESKKLVKSDGSNPIHQSLILVKDPLMEYNKNALIYQGLTLAIADNFKDSAVYSNALKTLGAVALLYGAIEISKGADHWFMSKYYFIDTAMVPEIIYHEYAHIAMSDTMKTVHSVPVIEGMADYFAATIADRRNMYEKLKGISSNKGKDRGSKMRYHPFLEGEWNSTSDFTLSVLWQGREAFEKYNKSRQERGQENNVDYEQLVFHAHQKLDENSDIANHLTRALLESCRDNCENPRTGMNLLNQVFEKKGFN